MKSIREETANNFKKLERKLDEKSKELD